MSNEDKLLTEALVKIKKDYEKAIISGGTDETHSLIRSKKLIEHLHEYIKERLIANGVHKLRIYPPIGKSSPELKMSGFLKEKDQDISVLPELPKEEIIKEGVLIGKKDKVSKDIMNKSISINIRSQLSSLSKNFDTLFERTFAEPLNLHLRAPKLIMGEVYMVPLVAYDPDAIKEKKVSWREVLPIKYIPAFSELNNRLSDEIHEYKYERVCLLIVDFRKDPPEIVNSAKTFVDNKLIKEDEMDSFSMNSLTMENFIHDILNIYEKRHGSIEPLKKASLFF